MYEIGRVYIWQNQVAQFTHLNGTETTVTGPPVRGDLLMWRRSSWYWPTDTVVPLAYRLAGADAVFAEAGDLRPKNDPTGERGIMDLFKLPEYAL